MKEAILIYKKKKFINWFLDTYRLKRPDSSRLLKFIMKQERILLNTHFVEDVRKLPNALMISATDAPTVAFLCRVRERYYDNIDEIIEVLASDPPEELFIRLSFDREFICSMCGTVIMKPETRDKLFYHQVVKDLEEEINRAFGEKDKRKDEMMAEINLALEKGDKELFNSLAEMYKEFFI